MASEFCLENELGDQEIVKETESFQKSKRNTLFWSTSLLILTFLHTDEPIKAPYLDGLSAPVWLLGFGIACLVVFHLTGFLLDRRLVIWKNSNLVVGNGNSNLNEAVLERLSALESSSHGLIIENASAESSIVRLKEVLSSLKSEITENKRVFVSEINSRISSEIDLGIKLSSESDIEYIEKMKRNFIQSKFDVKSIDLFGREILEMDQAISRIDVNRRRFDEIARNSYSDMNKLSKNIKMFDRGVFHVWDTSVTLFFSIFSISIFYVDTVTGGVVVNFIKLAVHGFFV